MFEFQESAGNLERKWIKVESNLTGLDNQKSQIDIEVMEDGKPRAMAFFDIDGTLAHLDVIHGKTISRLFPKQEPKELEETYYNGFKLGNSFREFDRMNGIYVNGHLEWRDPEFYIKNRLVQYKKEIDEPGSNIHNIAAEYLRRYGEIAGEIADEIYKNNPEAFKKANIEPILRLAEMYSRIGIPIVGFTANAKVFVDKLAKYLKLYNIFIDIATDETMVGGGKEIAIHHLINTVQEKGICVPKDRLIFVGDSLRGDIGISLLAKEQDKEIKGQGILVLKDKYELIKIKKQINENTEINNMVRSIDIHALIIENVPKDENDRPMLWSRYREKFLEKL